MLVPDETLMEKNITLNEQLKRMGLRSDKQKDLHKIMESAVQNGLPHKYRHIIWPILVQNDL